MDINKLGIEAFRKLQKDLLNNQVLSIPDDFFGGPHMKCWSEMSEQEQEDTKTWWETKE